MSDNRKYILGANLIKHGYHTTSDNKPLIMTCYYYVKILVNKNTIFISSIEDKMLNDSITLISDINSQGGILSYVNFGIRLGMISTLDDVINVLNKHIKILVNHDKFEECQILQDMIKEIETKL